MNSLFFIIAVGRHPESTIRAKTVDQTGGIADGYYHLSGPTAQIALEKRFTFVSDGKADLWNSALHGLFGLGIDF